MIHLVIDTNIILSGLKSRHGASNKLLSLIGSDLFEIHISIPLILEYEEVLNRNKEVLKLNQEIISEFLDSICFLAVRHEKVHFNWRPFLPDINDEFILDLAVLGNCDYIVTYNQKDFVGIDVFGIQVIEPKELLKVIGEI